MSPTNSKPVAVVTGAARGIGLACALRLARAGFNLAMADWLAAELAAAAVIVREAGADVIELAGDVADHGAVLTQGAQVLDRWGRIDVLVNNAGVSQPKPLLEISEAEWDRTIAINLKGYFNWCKAAAPAMMERRGGRIINISSVNAQTGAGPNAVSKVAYVTAKAGALGLTRALARELAPNVLVNAVCPGAIETDLTRERFSARREVMERGIPMGRLGTPEDIAEVVWFLAAAKPMYMTGEVVDVDGGQWIN
jgi:3-oxoacyl-[acyl-carrier protein] reductase